MSSGHIVNFSCPVFCLWTIKSHWHLDIVKHQRINSISNLWFKGLETREEWQFCLTEKSYRESKLYTGWYLSQTPTVPLLLMLSHAECVQFYVFQAFMYFSHRSHILFFKRTKMQSRYFEQGNAVSPLKAFFCPLRHSSSDESSLLSLLRWCLVCAMVLLFNNFHLKMSLLSNQRKYWGTWCISEDLRLQMLWAFRSVTTEKSQRTIKQDELLAVALVQIRAKGVCMACGTPWFITVQLTPNESIAMSLVWIWKCLWVSSTKEERLT